MSDKVAVKAFIRIRESGDLLRHTKNSVMVQRENGEEIQYSFDRVFGTRSTQSEIFQETRAILEQINKGYNATIFCYGNTGAGKTYTMVGTKESPGLIYNLIGELLKVKEFCISYFEIYNEKIYDLLEPKELCLRELNGTIILPNAYSKRIRDIKEFEEIFTQGTKNRTTGETKLNKNSSRSHSILRVVVGECKLHLIDLAGSENNRKTGNEGVRLAESSNINRSLFVLGKVVNSIIKKECRVPYRDSKLTRLLQDSLGGTSICYIIANVVNNQEYYAETLSTLNFASKSRNIVNTSINMNDRVQALCKVNTQVNNKLLGRNRDNINASSTRSTELRFVTKSGLSNDVQVEKKGQKIPGVATAQHKSSALVEITNRRGIKETSKPLTGVKKIHDLRSDEDESLVVSRRRKRVEKCDNSSLLRTVVLDRPDILLTPRTKEKSYRAFLKRAKEYEESQNYKAAKEDYKTMQKFCDNDFIRNKIETLTSLVRKGKKKIKLAQSDVLSILNSGNFVDIKRLSNIGDKRAQTIINYISGGNFFESLDDLKLLFSEKVVQSITGAIDII